MPPPKGGSATAGPSPTLARPNRSGRAVTDLAGLATLGLIDRAQADDAVLADVVRRYAVAVTPTLADAIDRTDPADPLARQLIPDPREAATAPDEIGDPIGDDAYEVSPGLVHRYPDRVLLKLLSACPIYCRFCFRRERVGPGGAAMTADDLDRAVAYIAERPDIFEAILTGGDPLMLSARRLADVFRRLAAIPHLGVVRLHSRVPVAAPDRIDAATLDVLGGDWPFAVAVAVHSNHAAEWTDPAAEAVDRLRRAGVMLLGQTVLLAGVNDKADTLEALFRRMLRAGVKPYYLHHPDRAPGTAHFRVPLEKGRALVETLRGRLTGIGMPTYVVDTTALPDGDGGTGFGKVPAEAPHVTRTPDGGWVARDRRGRTLPVEDPPTPPRQD